MFWFPSGSHHQCPNTFSLRYLIFHLLNIIENTLLIKPVISSVFSAGEQTCLVHILCGEVYEKEIGFVLSRNNLKRSSSFSLSSKYVRIHVSAISYSLSSRLLPQSSVCLGNNSFLSSLQ